MRYCHSKAEPGITVYTLQIYSILATFIKLGGKSTQILYLIKVGPECSNAL